MGPELGDLFTELSSDLHELVLRWNQYVELFATNGPRIELLNRSAPGFFAIIQQTLFEDALLRIARMAGPDVTGAKQNLSVRRIPPLINDPPVRQKVEQLLLKVNTDTEFAIDWRNRYIAHRDLDHLRNPRIKPLAHASRDTVDEALQSLAKMLNAVERHFARATTSYRNSPFADGASALLHVVRDGLRREEIREAKLEDEGAYDPADWDDDLPPV